MIEFFLDEQDWEFLWMEMKFNWFFIIIMLNNHENYLRWHEGDPRNEGSIRILWQININENIKRWWSITIVANHGYTFSQ